MNPTHGFLVFLVVTLACLAGVVCTGYAAKRTRHVPLVVCAVASLGVTIYYAEQLGEIYDLKGTGWIYPFHLSLAKLTTLGYLLPIGLGILTTRVPVRLVWHRRAAWTILILTALTAATGSWMVLRAEPNLIESPPTSPATGELLGEPGHEQEARVRDHRDHHEQEPRAARPEAPHRHG